MGESEFKALASNVARLSDLLTRERETLHKSYLKDEDLRKAYISYFVPANMHKIHIPLRELSLHPNEILRKERLRILDLGSGPGTAIFGILDFFAAQKERPSLEFIAVDPIAENLRDAEKLFQSIRERVYADASLSTLRSSIERTKSLPKGPFDMIILSNVLSEVTRPDPERVQRKVNILKVIMKGTLANDGSCIIIEPALRETSREMLEVRDSLLKDGFHAYSPCLMDDACPALGNPRDWCHEDIPWEPPAIIKEIDRLTGLRKDSLKFSYLVIRKDGLSVRDIYGDKSFRIVSEPLSSKGKLEFYICGAGGRRLIVRLDKDKSRLNESFEGLKRGDIVSFENMIDVDKRLRIGKDTAVFRKRSCPAISGVRTIRTQDYRL